MFEFKGMVFGDIYKAVLTVAAEEQQSVMFMHPSGEVHLVRGGNALVFTHIDGVALFLGIREIPECLVPCARHQFVTVAWEPYFRTVKRLASIGRKIDAIKMVRQATDLSLVEAKSLVENPDFLKW